MSSVDKVLLNHSAGDFRQLEPEAVDRNLRKRATNIIVSPERG